MQGASVNETTTLGRESLTGQTGTVGSHTIATPRPKPGWLLLQFQAHSKGANAGGTITIAVSYKTTDGTTSTTATITSSALSIAATDTVAVYQIAIYVDDSATAVTATYTAGGAWTQGVDIRANVMDLDAR